MNRPKGKETQAKIDFHSQLSRAEFNFFCQLIYQQTGLHITEEKKPILESRLNKRLKALNLTSFGDYSKFLKRKANSAELTQLINAVTTNKTSFFRERAHFELLLERLTQAPAFKTQFIWSAACSSGEEVYSLAISCEELKQQNSQLDYRILGTDIDTDRLAMASNGRYSEFQLEGVKPELRRKYFNCDRNQQDLAYQVSSDLKSKVKFRQFNLMTDFQSTDILFDYIFIRNALIYFSKPDAAIIVTRLLSSLNPNGLLFVGLSESLQNMDLPITMVAPSVYSKISA